MVAIFNPNDFDFHEGEPGIEVIDNYFLLVEERRDPTKYHLIGMDTFQHEYYPLAINVDDLPTAEMLCTARMRNTERFQPVESSGGANGIQDRVFMQQPRREDLRRYFGPAVQAVVGI